MMDIMALKKARGAALKKLTTDAALSVFELAKRIAELLNDGSTALQLQSRINQYRTGGSKLPLSLIPHLLKVFDLKDPKVLYIELAPGEVLEELEGKGKALVIKSAADLDRVMTERKLDAKKLASMLEDTEFKAADLAAKIAGIRADEEELDAKLAERIAKALGTQAGGKPSKRSYVRRTPAAPKKAPATTATKSALSTLLSGSQGKLPVKTSSKQSTRPQPAFTLTEDELLLLAEHDLLLERDGDGYVLRIPPEVVAQILYERFAAQ